MENVNVYIYVRSIAFLSYRLIYLFEKKIFRVFNFMCVWWLLLININDQLIVTNNTNFKRQLQKHSQSTLFFFFKFALLSSYLMVIKQY